ncbi:hypothetical protein STEG23_033804 [Scotinomys teguina]
MLYSQSSAVPTMLYSQSSEVPTMLYSQSSAVPTMLYSQSSAVPTMLYSQSSEVPTMLYSQSSAVPTMLYSQSSAVPTMLYSQSSAVPTMLYNQEQPCTTVFRDTSYFIDWKKHNLFLVPTLDLNLDTDLVLPDVSYRVESSKGASLRIWTHRDQHCYFSFVDFHSGVPVQPVEIWGLHTLLTAHLSAILSESRSTVQDSIQLAVDQVMERHHQAAQAHQRLQGSLSVAVNSIMSVLTGSTCSSFRKTCLQALEAADTQEFGTKLHRIFYDTTQHRLQHHCSCDTEQHPTPEKRHSAQSAEGCRGHENIGPESVVGKTPGVWDLWLQEVSNLSEWLSPGRRF